MKIRSDYVSNSSSSSFIVSLSANYPFKDFVDAVVKSCSFKSDVGYTKDVLKGIDSSNRRNLDYCLNTYRLLYLGELLVGTREKTITDSQDCENFLSYYNRVKNLDGQKYEELVSQKDDEIIVKENYWMRGKPVSWDRMDSLFWVYGRREGKETDEDRKNLVEKIVNLERNEWQHGGDTLDTSDNIELYEITIDTILNTEDLIKEGQTVYLDEWCKDLEALKKRIKDGQRLFGITLNQGGSGMSVGSIFGTNGWDSDFNRFADVEILNSECG